MSTNTLTALSDQMAEAVAAIEPSVVQVQGRRRPVSGIAYASGIVLTTTRALGREDGARIRTGDGKDVAAELVGWDPATSLAVLRADELQLKPAEAAQQTPRVGQIALAIARSWSNALTASAGIVAVIGGPLRTGRGQAIDQIIRVTAPVHDGFSGGAVVDASGRVIGVATAAEIRGFAVVIPASIAWKSAQHVLEHGRPRVGFIGIAGQPVQLPERQRTGDGRDRGLLVVGVTTNGPAERAGILIGDVIVEFDGQPIASTDDLLRLLTGERVGRSAKIRIVRGGTLQDVTVTVGERPAS
jgi:serine protease Do